MIMKLLLVDDNRVDMKEFRDELILDGHEVDHVHDYTELQELCNETKHFDGIILDLMFPPEDGIPILESDFGYRGGQFLYEPLIKKHFPNVPFVILTAMDETTSIYQQVIKNMSQYKSYSGCFQKPVEVHELIEAFYRNNQ